MQFNVKKQRSWTGIHKRGYQMSTEYRKNFDLISNPGNANESYTEITHNTYQDVENERNDDILSLDVEQQEESHTAGAWK